MTTESILQIGAVLFPGFELLDIYGPLEMFGLLESRVRITVVAPEKGPVASTAGPAGMADLRMADASNFDVLLVPGGMGTRREMNNPVFLGELRRLAEASRSVGTICTGSLLLARTGLLDGRRATSNKRSFRLIASASPAVQWVHAARWVVDGKFYTSSGVSAGMDMALALIADRFDLATSLQIATRAEYEWHQDSTRDPFATGAGA